MAGEANVKKTGELAEQISQIIKECPEATKDNADVLFKQLEAVLKPPELISKPLTLEQLNQQSVASRLTKVQTGLDVNTHVIIVLASIFGGGVLMLSADINEYRLLRETSDAELKRIKKEFHRIDYRLPIVEQKLCCSACRKAVIIKYISVCLVLCMHRRNL